MANLTPDFPATFDPVLQIETTMKVLGGAGQIANLQAQALVNRDQYLLNLIQAINLTSILGSQIVPEANGGTGFASFALAFAHWFNNLPTTLPGSSGQFWNNGGTLAQS